MDEPSASRYLRVLAPEFFAPACRVPRYYHPPRISTHPRLFPPYTALPFPFFPSFSRAICLFDECAYLFREPDNLCVGVPVDYYGSDLSSPRKRSLVVKNDIFGRLCLKLTNEKFDYLDDSNGYFCLERMERIFFSSERFYLACREKC